MIPRPRIWRPALSPQRRSLSGSPYPPRSATSHPRPPFTGASLVKAIAAALSHTGGGPVIDTEAGDDGASYEVEVSLHDGRQVDVLFD